jgi:hypothetical protein
MAETIYQALDRIDRTWAEPQVDVGPQGSSLDLLSAIYRDPTRPLTVRMRAAIAALPFEHPKLAVVANIGAEGFADALEEAMARSGKSVVIHATPELPKPGD